MGWTVYNSDGQILQGSSTLADDAVTTAKILDDAVTYAKMQNLATADRVLGSTSTGVIGEVQIVPDMLASNAVTTAKILDANVTNAKLANMAANTIRVRNAGDAGVPQEVALSTTQILIGNGTGFTPAALNGEATMSNAGGILIADNIIDEANLKADNSPTNDHVLTAKSSASGGLTWAAAGGGKVLQVVTYNKTSGSNMTSSSWSGVTNFEVPITLSSTSSKVFIMATDNSLYRNNNNNFYITLYRNSTNLGQADYGLYYGYGHTLGAVMAFNYLDSPGIANTAITYKIYAKVITAGTLSFVNGGGYATITCMEIGA